MPATTEELNKQRKERTEAREKAEQKTAEGAESYLEELEKYHIAGQGYMVAPRPPVAETPEGLTPETIPEFRPRSDSTRWVNKPARIGAEEALRLQAKSDEEAAQAKSAGGYYYPVVEAQEEEEDENDEEAKKQKKTSPPPPPKPPQQPPAGH